MAAMSIVLARPVGNLTDRVHPRIVVGTGFALSLVGMVLLDTQFKVDSPIWLICVFQVVLGCGNAFIGRRPPPRPTATCRCASPAQVQVSTTRPVRSAPSWVPPRSRW